MENRLDRTAGEVLAEIMQTESRWEDSTELRKEFEMLSDAKLGGYNSCLVVKWGDVK